MIENLFQNPLQIEIAASNYIQSFASAPLDQFFLIITQLGNPALWFLLAALLYWKGEEKKSMALATVLLVTSAIVGGLKSLTGRLRPSPEEFRVLVHETENLAFPSGHAATAAGIFGYYWEKFEHAAKLFGIVIVLCVMTSRVYLGAHFLLDVIVGAGIGFVIGRAIHHYEKNFEGIKFNREKLLEEIWLAAFIGAAIIISLMFRPLAMGSGLLGFFAGAITFKLLDLDSEKITGPRFAAKSLLGLIGVGSITLASASLGLEPEGYFLAGIWVSLAWPALYEKISQNRFSAFNENQAQNNQEQQPTPGQKMQIMQALAEKVKPAKMGGQTTKNAKKPMRIAQKNKKVKSKK